MPRNAPVPTAGPIAVSDTSQQAGIIFPSASRAATGGGVHNGPEYVNSSFRGLRLLISTTAVGVAGTLVVKIQNRDPASGNWVDIPGATTGTINTNTLTTLTIYPAATESATVDIADPLGVRWRIVATVGTNAVTFSVTGEYLG